MKRDERNGTAVILSALPPALAAAEDGTPPRAGGADYARVRLACRHMQTGPGRGVGYS